ncbi:hypothetical protein GCM10017557_09770 [Streptomyces aurantiacus]|uniref:Uncharacterized protein n=1 Tax=Streptomyces aurantiacus TaxID=47760 RepID=A0A7G1NSA1_9ACTN|nr:hypothetical protein GCM10017557_09770 [Streptomyces aurantiacus]
MEERAAARAGEFVHLSRSAAWRIRTRTQRVTSEKQLYVYLVACDVPEKAFPAWAQTCNRAAAGAQTRRARTAGSARPMAANSRRSSPATARRRSSTARTVPRGETPVERPMPTATCHQVSRIRHATIIAGAGCPVCSTP